MPGTRKDVSVLFTEYGHKERAGKDQMTEQQQRFVEHYARTANATEAARLAGYSERSARSIGNRLLTKANIREAIANLNDASSRKRVADAEEIKAFWTEILRNKAEKTADRLKASEYLSKASGMFITAVTQKIPESANRDDVIIYLPALETDDEDK